MPEATEAVAAYADASAARHDERIRTLEGVLLVGAIVLAAMLVLMPLAGASFGASLVVYGSGLVLHVAHLLWVRHAPSRKVAISHCLTYFAYVTTLLATEVGGMRAPAALVYPPLIVMAGLVWSGRAALGMALLVAGAGALLAALETAQRLPHGMPEATPWRMWLLLTACVTVTAALMRFALSAIARAHAHRIAEERRFATQREKLEQQLRESHKLEALGRLAGGVAHDFNNLLTVILGSVEVLQYKTQAEEARDIKQAALRAASLTRQLLAFGRRQVMQAESVDLNRALENGKPLLARLLNEEIQLEVETAPNPCYAIIDRAQLDQVLINLVVNARDAMPSGGTIRIACGPGAPPLRAAHAHDGNGDGRGNGHERHDTTRVWLSVQDSGVGIPQDAIDRIFEPFFTTKSAGLGTGLGLATVHGIVTQSGGSISVQSELGRGTTFFVMLPAGGAEATANVTPVPARMPAPTQARVVVVEDEPALRAVVKAMLEAGGYSVSAPPSAAEALAQLDSRCDLLVTDVVMYGMSGPELARRAREARPELRVLFMSGHADELVEARGVLRTDVQFVAKPFTSEALLRRVAEVLAHSA
jgi:signal transduction histidine kinase